MGFYCPRRPALTASGFGGEEPWTGDGATGKSNDSLFGQLKIKSDKIGHVVTLITNNFVTQCPGKKQSRQMVIGPKTAATQKLLDRT